MKAKSLLEKADLVSFVMNDMPLGVQETVLKSKKSEMDEEYQERLENKLWNMSIPKLKRIKSSYLRDKSKLRKMML